MSGITCTWLRVFKNIFCWEECYISFWIAISSFFLSVAVFFLPWGFLLKWTLRIIIWVAFGPWMKLADIYYFSRLNEETDEQKEQRTNNLQRERQKWLEKQKLEAQIAREKASKLRDFKQYMFGQHICKVNILKKDRYYDIPLSSSSATLYKESKTLGEVAMQEAGYRRTRVDGQQLVGEMIPTVSMLSLAWCVERWLLFIVSLSISLLKILQIYETPSTEAPTGKPTNKTDSLEKGSPGTFSDDSYSAAAIKVFSIIVGAGAITWFAIPLIAYRLRFVLPGGSQ